MRAPELCNLLGTGEIPIDIEDGLLAEGVKFAGYFYPKSGNPILITSIHADIYSRWAQQIVALDKEERGLPSQYLISERIPA